MELLINVGSSETICIKRFKNITIENENIKTGVYDLDEKFNNDLRYHYKILINNRCIYLTEDINKRLRLFNKIKKIIINAFNSDENRVFIDVNKLEKKC